MTNASWKGGGDERRRALDELVRALDEAADDVERNGPASAEEIEAILGPVRERIRSARPAAAVFPPRR
jgi:ABC-type nitrate/sulfonate/bicarbonate transport system substrate-binding protein